MTRPALVWYVFSRSVAKLARWCVIALVVAVLGAILGSLVFVVIAAYVGWGVYRDRPVLDLVAAPITDDRYREHVARVLASLGTDLDGERPSAAAGPVASESATGILDVPSTESVSFQ